MWLVPTGVDFPAGRFVFTTEGALAGLSIVERGHSAIVPAAQLLKAAQQSPRHRRGPEGTLGVDVQPLSPALAAAAGTDSGVIVSMVDPRGPRQTSSHRPTSSSTSTDTRSDRLMTGVRASLRIEAGDSVSLRVRAAGERREVQHDSERHRGTANRRRESEHDRGTASVFSSPPSSIPAPG